MSVYLARVNKSPSPQVEVDEYVPVTLTWPRYHTVSEPPASMMLELEGCLFEVKTDRSNGELIELILVDVQRKNLVRVPAPLEWQDFTPGVPCLNSEEEPEESANSMQARLHPNGFHMTLRSEKVTQWIGDQNCIFGFSSSDRLANILIRLSPEDVGLAFS
ncbi:hypothetical protein OG898_28080 [Streptomyces sp. NBC_00193]|uniref:hypothetical protein n=1 Tax=Streptomyces sp. NBC_00193 TaxID=2975675 RepID=UPI002253957C|nr:hypothetical protein [Streptomyces sp. NBC_00193]MCX5300298.1 hypothetical protein [Streptomyces sp. NBC_00193]